MTFFGLFLPRMHNCRALSSLFGHSTLVILLAVILLGGVAVAPPRAWAQEIIATVNGQPITDLDLSQREKLLRVLRQPTTRDAAMQSLIDDALENQETSQFGVKPDDAQIGQEMMRTAKKLKIAPEVFFGELQRSGASDGHIKDHFSAELAFFSLIASLSQGRRSKRKSGRCGTCERRRQVGPYPISVTSGDLRHPDRHCERPVGA